MASHYPSTSASVARLAKRIPKGTWDTHMHVVDPRIFPLSKDAQYQPSPHTLDDAHAFLTEQLGIEKMVIVQPSIYGNNNACALDGTQKLGPENGRAVIQFDPNLTTPEQLREWHAQGARGVRLNFKSVGAKVEASALRESLNKYANAVRDLGWVLELYIPLESVPLLEPIVPDLGPSVKLCIDHFGHPSKSTLETAKTAQEVPGFDSLIRLLKQGQTWVKISASYRLSKDPRDPLMESLCREIVRCRPDRCVWATDWPHTRKFLRK
jgi:predicted TIM-barrel fold metal-dependent hydrolase